MRELEIKIPVEREQEVLGVLQGDACQLKNVTRVTDGINSVISAYLFHEEVGYVLNALDKVGCGTAYGKVAVLPVLLLKPLPRPTKQERHLRFLVDESTWRTRGRLAIEEMHSTVAAGCIASFDFFCQALVAGWICSVGLATDNAVMIVASMLMSPLLGPILAFSFGTSTRDWHMVRLGIAIELIGLAITFVVGFIAGLIVSAWTDVAVGYDWPTQQMASRGNPNELVSGILYAVPSGAGVAFSTTSGGPTAIVGIAIAAALLTPVVNAGLNLGFAVAGASRVGMDATKFYNICAISMALYGINVVCIYLACQLVFYVKDVVPVRKQLSTYKDLRDVTATAKRTDGCAPDVQQSGSLKMSASGTLSGGESALGLGLGAVAIDIDPAAAKLAQQAAAKWRTKTKGSDMSSGTMTSSNSGR